MPSCTALSVLIISSATSREAEARTTAFADQVKCYMAAIRPERGQSEKGEVDENDKTIQITKVPYRGAILTVRMGKKSCKIMLFESVRC